MRDVVITGIGAVSPFGVGVESFWRNLRAGHSGIDWISSIDIGHLPVRYGGEVKDFDPRRHLKKPSGLRQDRSMQMGFVAAAEALRDAGLLGENDQVSDALTIGTVVGSGLGPCFEAEASYGNFFTRGWKAVRPMTVPLSMHNALAGALSTYFKLRGANYVLAAACSSGALAIGQAYQAIASGVEDIVLCGGSDSPFTPGMFSAWTNLRVLAAHDDPQQACRPFDRKRNGLVLAEGAAMLVLESRESAQARNRRPLARLSGYGAASDAHHITAPQVAGQVLAMQRCLRSAGRNPFEVDYINAHGTATLQNDRTEAESIHTLFGRAGRRTPVSSIKSMIGHTLGASGALEAIACVQALREKFVPPTLNCDTPDFDLGLDFVPHEGRPHPVRRVMSNSFGFGGSNCCLMLEQCAE